MPSSWTQQQVVSNLARSGTSWNGDVISYAFPQVRLSWMSAMTEGSGFSGLGSTQAAAAREAIGLWDDLIAPDTAQATGPSNITFGNTTRGVSYAYSYYPGAAASCGSVWVNPNYDFGTNNLVSPTRGSWGYETYIHEIGHALGLSHPGNYDGGSPTYAADAPYAHDSLQYTVMSYFKASNTGADWIAGNGKEYYPQTPMIDDIAAIQSIYGAETRTRSGDTVYGFHASAGRDVFDFTQNAHPVLTIWDSGGADTLDLSGFASPSRIDLAAGHFSDCAAMTSNIAIAYGTAIENAVGGAGADRITGNDLANVLRGGGGNDTLSGGAGRDILCGGAGSDSLAGGAGADRFVFRSLAGIASDAITDFQPDSDRIDLSAIDAVAGVEGRQAFHFVGSGGLGAAGDLAVRQTSANTLVKGDIDGDHAADFTLTLRGLHSLHGTDFVL